MNQRDPPPSHGRLGVSAQPLRRYSLLCGEKLRKNAPPGRFFFVFSWSRMGMEGDYGALTGDLRGFSVRKMRENPLFCTRCYPAGLPHLHGICTSGRNWVDEAEELGRKMRTPDSYYLCVSVYFAYLPVLARHSLSAVISFFSR